MTRSIPSSLLRYGLAVALVALTAAGHFLLDPWLGKEPALFLFLVPAIFSGMYGGFGPCLLAGFASAATALTLFMEPRGEILPHGTDQLRLALFASVVLLTAWLSGRDRKVRADLDAALAEVRRLDRAKDELFAAVSHELRNPLNAMAGWVKVLRLGRAGPADLAMALDVIESGVETQTRLINDLLDANRIASGKLALTTAEIEPGEVVRLSVEAMRPAAEAKGIALEADLGPAGPIPGDRGRLMQVLRNLLSNSIKFTPSGGRVRVRLETAGPAVRIAVSDTGKGISPRFLPHVFEPYRQQDDSSVRVHGGLGLGLSIVRRIVELHGGRVLAESPGEGRGATFTVELPAPPPGASGPREAGATALRGTGAAGE
jgi:signal transduction histidine kinase